MKKQIERTILHIRDLERRLNEADNNLRYIKIVQALKKSLDKLYSLLLRDTALQREYQSTKLLSSFILIDCQRITLKPPYFCFHPAFSTISRLYNPQNEMFLTFQTNCSFIKNETASKEHKKMPISRQ